MHVAVLGTGIMGTGIALSLIRAGHQVTVWNRNSSRTATAQGAGARVASTPAEAAAEADSVLLVLFDAAAVLDVLDQAAKDDAQKKIWVQMSTIGLDGTNRVVELTRLLDVPIVEAMMLGTKGPAENGELTLLTAGDPALLEQAAPVFQAIAKRVLPVGPQLNQATALKLAVNAWILSLTALVGQSLAMTRQLGLDPQLFLDAIDGNATNNPYAQMKGLAMVNHSYEPSFPISGGLKDLELIQEATLPAGVRQCLLDAVAEMYTAASEGGHRGDDLAAVHEAFLRT